MRMLRAALERGYRSIVAGKSQAMRFSEVALDHAAATCIARRTERLRALERQLDRRSPAARVAQWQIGLVRANTRLAAWSSRGLDRYTRRLELARAALDAEDPTRPLARGFAIVTKDGVALRDVATLVVGDAVTAQLERGTFGARVESVDAE